MSLLPSHKIGSFTQKIKYEVLLFGLFQHLFVGVVCTDLAFYGRYVWMLNMMVLAFCTAGLFFGAGRLKLIIRGVLIGAVIYLPLLLPQIGYSPEVMFWVSLCYLVFFIYIFTEVLRFLIKPSYINRDIISAAACGYLLLIEVYVFAMQMVFYRAPESFHGVTATGPASIYIDFVYLGTIMLTSIGFGDITPAAPYSKLLLSVLGLTGHFYTVVLMGILIGKFSGTLPQKTDKEA
jgi:nitrate reductase NapE component